MYHQTVRQKITEIKAATRGSIPPQSDPECIMCLGTGFRKKTESEVLDEREKTSPNFFKFLSVEKECECTNRDRVEYDRNIRNLKFLEAAFEAAKIPIEYQGMCFRTWSGNVDKDYLWFVERKCIEVGGVVKRGFLFVGPVGVGKTHMAVAIMNGLMLRHHMPCLYVDVSDLLAELRESYNTNRTEGGFSETTIIKRYQQIPVLLLDDISVEKTSEWVRDRIFQIINWRYSNKLITLMTSNDHPDDLVEKLGARTVSRLNGLTDFVEIEGDDNRGKKIVVDSKLEKNLTYCENHDTMREKNT